MSHPFRIGIMGGMGPEAGVLLQQLIIDYTPAQKDQDHLEVITYTNPHVPDRTESLEKDGGASYLQAVIDSVQLLDKTGVNIIVISCNTAHARFDEIQASIKTPLLHIVNLAKQEIIASDGKVGILATDGTVKSSLFTIPDQPDKTMTPNTGLQHHVMAAIHDIKSGKKDESVIDRLENVVNGLKKLGCEKMVLGCTELSLCYNALRQRQGDILIDPMRLAAKKVVAMATENDQ